MINASKMNLWLSFVPVNDFAIVEIRIESGEETSYGPFQTTLKLSTVKHFMLNSSDVVVLSLKIGAVHHQFRNSYLRNH